MANLSEASQDEQAVDLATPTVIVLEEVCAAAGFGLSTPQRDDVANCLANLYSDGYFTVEGLRQAFIAYVEREIGGVRTSIRSGARIASPRYVAARHTSSAA